MYEYQPPYLDNENPYTKNISISKGVPDHGVSPHTVLWLSLSSLLSSVSLSKLSLLFSSVARAASVDPYFQIISTIKREWVIEQYSWYRTCMGTRYAYNWISRLAVLGCVLCRSAGANFFRRMGHGRKVSKQTTAVSGEDFWDLGV